ncbi:MAG: hypothetical protein HC804_10690 [Anaerolineae bacterium]|nr:hypothetical protein [Anaerolineae bacterium]
MSLGSDIYTMIKGLISEDKLETAVAKLEEEGFTTSSAISLVTTLQQPVNQGVIVIFQREKEQFATKASLIVIQSHQASWLIQKDQAKAFQIGLEPFTPKHFIDRLTILFK